VLHGWCLLVSDSCRERSALEKPALLKVENLSKCYGILPVLSNVSFELNRGEALGYIGANGSGKSTTVKMLLGLLEPTSGKILLDGHDIQHDLNAWRSRFGYVPELPVIYPFLSGMEHLMLVGRLRNLPEPPLQEQARALLDLLSLSDFCDAPMAEYSKGMKQRVLIAAAILHDPDVLILDEPLSGLDATSSQLLRALIVALRDSGKCILYCSHTIRSVEGISTKIALLRNGTLGTYGDTASVTSSLVETEVADEIDVKSEVHSLEAAKEIIGIISRSGK
jgi:ABC-2 type transport system ATP-binding protein